jgi:hypothetical protein
LAKESDGEVIEVNKQTKLDELFNKLHFILRDAANRAKTHVIKLIDCNKIKVTTWWNPDLEEMLKKSKEECRNYKLTDKYLISIVS